MPEITKARTARKPHACESCHWRHLGTATCVEHAIARGDGYKTGACQTFCHGDVPCARPDGHEGEHSCRRCIERGGA